MEKLKQYGITPIQNSAGDLDLDVYEQEFGSWVLVTEIQPVFEKMIDEIETLKRLVEEK